MAMHRSPSSTFSASLCALAAALSLAPQGAEAYGEYNKFLIVSSSVTHEIAYCPLPQQTEMGETKLRTLISSGLTFPQGLAVDPWRRYLYVADPTLNKLVYYVLSPDGEERLYVGEQKTAATGVEVRWVSTDTLGNVYFTVESTQKIMRITAAQLDKGEMTPQEVFEGSKSGMVSAPGGIAIDNYFVYWTNKLDPTKAGTLVRGFHEPQSQTTELAKINAKTYGVCMAVNNVFFTDETKNLYGVNRLGGNKPVIVQDGFAEPRGLAWDGENTVFVADKKKNAVYSFAANQPTLREGMPIKLVAYMQGAYGAAVYTVGHAAGALALAPSLLLLALPALLAGAASSP